MWEYRFNKLILIINISGVAVRKMAVLLSSHMFGRLSLESLLCLPLHPVKVNGHAISELLVLQNMESCGRTLGLHKKYKTKWVFLIGMYFIIP